MAAILEEQHYDHRLHILENTGSKTVYRMKCPDGYGKMTSFHIFPGIEMIYNDFRTSYCFEMINPKPHIMEINHCRQGRFECKLKKDTYAYLGEGNLAVNMWGNETSSSRFPLKIYKGITILIDLQKAQKSLYGILEGVEVDLNCLREKLCPKDQCMICKTPKKIDHIFQELYDEEPKIQLGYLRLKVLELLMILSVRSVPSSFAVSQYFSTEQVQKVKCVREDLTTFLSKNITLKELAVRYEISLTGLKSCFKAVYGSTVFAYRREYRMQVAAKMLKDTNYTIAEIAGQVGYENPGKFSSAFKQIMGITPKEYRRK